MSTGFAMAETEDAIEEELDRQERALEEEGTKTVEIDEEVIEAVAEVVQDRIRSDLEDFRQSILDALNEQRQDMADLAGSVKRSQEEVGVLVDALNKTANDDHQRNTSTEKAVMPNDNLGNSEDKQFDLKAMAITTGKYALAFAAGVGATLAVQKFVTSDKQEEAAPAK